MRAEPRHCLGVFALLMLSPWCASSAVAEAAACITSSAPATSTAEAGLPLCDELYPPELYDGETSPWRVGFGAGYGQRSNPLINSDDIPIYGIVQLSWFGERFFFDNGDVGAGLWEGRNWSVNLIAGVGGERSFFSYLNDASVSFAPELGGIEAGPDGAFSDDPELEFEPEAPDRDMVIDGGIEMLYEWRGMDFQLQALNDISDKHNGQEVWLSWGVPRRFGRWSINPSVGLTWLSEDAADYYYGVRPDEAMPGLSAYEVDASVNTFVRVALSYAIDEHWKIVSVWQYESLDDNIRDSSSVEEDHVETGFVGLFYEF